MRIVMLITCIGLLTCMLSTSLMAFLAPFQRRDSELAAERKNIDNRSNVTHI